MSQGEKWTVGRLLQWTTDFLKRHGADSPRLDAEVLLAEAMGCPRIALYMAFGDEPPEAARTAFRESVRRRAEGTPVAYLVSKREFYSLNFHVTPDVLIPRPETELLVVTLLDLIKARTSGPLTICDVGSGSGIIAVSVAKHVPEAKVVAVDISPAALRIAQLNATEHGVAERIEFIQSDLLEKLADRPPFDFVVSNPPYVSEAEFEKLAPDVAKYEPRLALVSGPKGTEVIERLIPQAAEHLQPGGSLLMEISPMIHEAVEALVDGEPRLRRGPTVKDLARHPRVVQAVRQ